MALAAILGKPSPYFKLYNSMLKIGKHVKCRALYAGSDGQNTTFKYLFLQTKILF